MKNGDCIAVIDVGKTNKKLLIFDESLAIVDSVYETFDEYIEDGVHFEDIEGMTAWYKRQLADFAPRYPIRAISVTTHGATAVCVGADGAPAVPTVAYTTDAGEAFRREFYDTFGSPVHLQQSTATAEVGSMINEAKVIYFTKKRWPERFEKVTAILNFPQYFGYVLTGKAGAEPTFLGCHTYLFDFVNRRYSPVAEKMGIVGKLPARIGNSWEVLGTVTAEIARETGLRADCIVTMGIHDSNSSLLPYLVKGFGSFVLNSTGTWCVAMHPAATMGFEPDELGKLVFYNMDAFFNPVKTSIFMGGLEFDTYLKILHAVNNRDDYLGYDPYTYRRVIREKKLFILPSVVRGTGLFPDSRPRVADGEAIVPIKDIQEGKAVPPSFKDFELSYAALNLSLAVQTRIAVRMAGFSGTGDIFTEGGFRKNKGYNAVLASMYPRARNCFTRLEEATAFGAALLGKAALTGKNPRELKDLFDIETTEVEKHDLAGLDEYAAEFQKRVAQQ